MGYMLDSQVFGARRDKPDIISKPGNYGYTEYKANGANETQNYSIKKGFNGRSISGDIEKSYLIDFGAFGAVSWFKHSFCPCRRPVFIHRELLKSDGQESTYGWRRRTPN